jgi:AcrR family transcriptional regulator
MINAGTAKNVPYLTKNAETAACLMLGEILLTWERILIRYGSSTDGRSHGFLDCKRFAFKVRIVKEHDERRNEILDVAQEFFYTKGYEQTSIRDIIDAVGIAKGTFYHYFASKNQLLDQLVERMLEHTMQMVAPIVADEQYDALQKLHLFFGTIENWKLDNRPYLKDIMRAYFQDDNVALRQRMKNASKAASAQPLARIVRQGIDEGVFNTRYPDEIGEIVIGIGQALAEKLAYMLLADEITEETIKLARCKIAVTNNSLERLLGAPSGSVAIFDFDRLQPWFERQEAHADEKEIAEWVNM